MTANITTRRPQSPRALPRRILGTLAAVVVSGALALTGAAAASADDDRITSTIGDWTLTTSGTAVSVAPMVNTDPATVGVEFTFPAVGTSGPMEYIHPITGEKHCLHAEGQSQPYHTLYWYSEARRTSLGYTCQSVTTVSDEASGLVGFRATGGLHDGRYLGDESGGKLVDWAQETFFGAVIPAISQVTPEAPVLEAATDCGAEPAVTVPTVTGVAYQQQRDGNTVTVTASAESGYQLVADAVTEWTFDVTPAQCESPALESVAPVAPTLIPAADCGVEATVEIPTTVGVTYAQARDGNVVVVTAQAADGYVLADGVATSWDLDVSAQECQAAPPAVQAVPTPTHPELANTGADPSASLAWIGALGLVAGGALLGMRQLRRR